MFKRIWNAISLINARIGLIHKIINNNGNSILKNKKSIENIKKTNHILIQMIEFLAKENLIKSLDTENYKKNGYDDDKKNGDDEIECPYCTMNHRHKRLLITNDNISLDICNNKLFVNVFYRDRSGNMIDVYKANTEINTCPICSRNLINE